MFIGLSLPPLSLFPGALILKQLFYHILLTKLNNNTGISWFDTARLSLWIGHRLAQTKKYTHTHVFNFNMDAQLSLGRRARPINRKISKSPKQQ